MVLVVDIMFNDKLGYRLSSKCISRRLFYSGVSLENNVIGKRGVDGDL